MVAISWRPSVYVTNNIEQHGGLGCSDIRSEHGEADLFSKVFVLPYTAILCMDRGHELQGP